ncbi:hypothetical protein [Burkholderia ubonensis]|nr:hypothetical protein [Burkholderia ubonensis]
MNRALGVRACRAPRKVTSDEHVSQGGCSRTRVRTGNVHASTHATYT